MKKAVILLVLILVAVCAFSQVSDRSEDIFPDVSFVAPIAHSPGDDAVASVTLYAMRNANHYLDAYKALVAYHNQTMAEARTLSDVNGKLSDALKAKDLDVLWNGTKWGIIGFVIGAATIGAIAAASK